MRNIYKENNFANLYLPFASWITKIALQLTKSGNNMTGSEGKNVADKEIRKQNNSSRRTDIKKWMLHEKKREGSLVFVCLIL